AVPSATASECWRATTPSSPTTSTSMALVPSSDSRLASGAGAESDGDGSVSSGAGGAAEGPVSSGGDSCAVHALAARASMAAAHTAVTRWGRDIGSSGIWMQAVGHPLSYGRDGQILRL